MTGWVAGDIPPEPRAQLTFFGGQWILLFRLSLFQLGLVKAGHLRQVRFVVHICGFSRDELKKKSHR